MPDLRDPIWQFIGAMIALAGLLFTAIIILLQNHRKSISCSVISISRLYPSQQDSSKTLQVLSEGKNAQDPHIVLLRIMNSGNVPILPDDYERPILLRFSSKAELLSAEVVEAVPTNLSVKPEVKEKTIELPRILMNKRDGFTLKILVDRFDDSIDVASRIAGITHISLRHEGKKEFIIVGGTGVGLNLLAEILLRISSKEPFQVASSVLGLLGGLLFLTASIRSRNSWWFWANEHKLLSGTHKRSPHP